MKTQIIKTKTIPNHTKHTTKATRVLKVSVHTETFSCVFVFFTVVKGIENNLQPLLETIKKRRKTIPCVQDLSKHELASTTTTIQSFMQNKRLQDDDDLRSGN